MNFLKLIISIIVTEGAGGLGAIFTSKSVSTWYKTITKPSFNPPSWIFGPVWTILYLLMGISAWLVWQKGIHTAGVKIALIVFGIQLLLNILWSIIFFGWHNPGGAFIEIIFLWLAIALTIFLFAKISAPAAWLLVPYILWVTFAGYLNFSIWQLNR